MIRRLLKNITKILMKQKTIFILIFNTILLIVILILVIIKNNDGIIDEKKENFDYYYFQELLYESIENDNQKLDISEMVKLKFDSLNINDTMPILVCYFSASGCQACIDFNINMIKENIVDYDNNKQVLFIAANYSQHKSFKLNSILNIERENLGLSIEKYSIPFYFVMEKGISRHVFLPDKNFPEHTKAYIESVKKRYFLKDTP